MALCNHASRCLLASMLLVGGCDSQTTARAKKLERHGDQPAVVVIDREVRGTTELVAEAEPNDDSDTAMALQAPAGVRGAIAGDKDVDYFRVTASADGTLSAVVGPVDGVDLVMEIVVGDKVLFKSDRGGAATEEGFPNLPVTNGQVLVLRISQFVKKGKRRSKAKGDEEEKGPAPYELLVSLGPTPTGQMEAEPNAGSDGAKELLLGDRGRGFIGWNKDIDHWRVSLLGFAARSSLDVDVRGVPGVALTLEVIDEKGNPVESRTGDKGGDVFVRNLEPGKGPSHYGLVVSGNRSNPSEPYSITASSRQLEPGEEVEPNDVADKASVAAEDGTSSGVARGFLLAGDKDYWRLPAPPEPSVLTLKLDVPSGADLQLAVVQGDNRAQANAGGAGVAEQLIGVPVDGGRPIVVVVSGQAASDAAQSYSLAWELGAPGGSDDSFDEPE